METKNITPTTQDETAGADIITQDKGNKELSSTRQKALFSLLTDGGKYTTRQISKLTPVSSPTKEVQRFRNRGIYVQDEWVDATPTIPRHKRYWIDPADCINIWEGCNE